MRPPLLVQCFTAWSAPPSPSLEGAQAILVHVAGENSATDPGRVNEALSLMVRDLHRQLDVPVIAQDEIKPCLIGIPVFATSSRQTDVYPRYLDTRDIAIWQKSQCERLGARTVVLVSYLPHYWRAAKSLEKLGLTVLVPPGITELYDPRNSQWWAQQVGQPPLRSTSPPPRHREGVGLMRTPRGPHSLF